MGVYERQIMLNEIGIEGQKRLAETSVLIVGAGGLGSPISLYLAAAGVGKIGLVDNDTISESNLQRQILYGYKDIGKLKIDIACNRIRDISPEVEVVGYDMFFTTDNAIDIAKGYNIIIDACDNNKTRYAMDKASKELGIPYIYGAISEFNGQVSVFNYKGAKSYAELFPARENINRNSSLGVIGALPGIVGSIEAMEAIKIATLSGEVLTNKLLTIDALTMEFTIFEL